MRGIIKRVALVVLLLLGAFAVSVVGQSSVSFFNKVRVTSGTADALTVSGGITAAAGGNVPIKSENAVLTGSWSAPVWTVAAPGAARVYLVDPTAPVNAGRWELASANGAFALTTVNDAVTSGAPAMTFTRSGTAVTGATIAANAISLVGPTTVAGNFSTTGSYSTSSDIAARDIYATRQFLAPNGSATVPGFGFASHPTTGLHTNGSAISWTVAGSGGGSLNSRGLGVGSSAYGTGNQTGGVVVIGRNESGGGAAGCLVLSDRTGGAMMLYADGNLLRYNILSDGCPTENNAAPHSGTVIGTQTSTAASKYLLGSPRNADLLEAVLRTRLHQFRYRDGRWNGETFTGIVTDESPWFGMDRDAKHPAGKALNEINGLGYTVGAIQAMHAEAAAMKARYAALERRLDAIEKRGIRRD